MQRKDNFPHLFIDKPLTYPKIYENNYIICLSDIIDRTNQ